MAAAVASGAVSDRGLPAGAPSMKASAARGSDPSLAFGTNEKVRRLSPGSPDVTGTAHDRSLFAVLHRLCVRLASNG